MISTLRGHVTERGDGWIVLDVHGVGYEVFVTDATARALAAPPDTPELQIRLINKEGEWDLFGFLDRFERSLFDLLRSVTGVGPKLALNLIGSLGPAGLVSRLAQRDAKALTQVSGVGPKLGQRMVLELAEKAGELSLLNRAAVQMDAPCGGEVEAALVALGYTKGEARRAADVAASAAPRASVEDQIKKALAELSSR